MPKLKRLLLVFITVIAFILLIQQPPIVKASNNHRIQFIEQEAAELYQQNQYPEAINLLKTAIKQYQKQGEPVNRAIATRNLALIYQRLGDWSQAQTNLIQAEKIVATLKQQSAKNQLLAQIWEVEGQVELSLGQPQAALETWQQATSLYQEQSNITGLIQGKIYQAYALQALGMYSQSLKMLTETNEQLQAQPDTLIKAQAALNLGNVLSRVGKYRSAERTLTAGMAIARQLSAQPTMADILLGLGHNAKLQGQTTAALNFYQQAIDISPLSDIQLRAKLDRLEVLVDDLDDRKEANNLVAEIEPLLSQMPLQQTAIQGQISLARQMLKLDIPPRQITNLLVTSIFQSQKLKIKRTEAEALGVLGHLYESHQEWSAAATITQRAMMAAQSINARELTYQWQWQLGRIFKAQGNRAEAIAAYTQATDNLKSLRSDLVAMSSQVQYSFRDQIEPVYRQLAALLFQPEASQAELNQTRQIIESLQVAELDNFFHNACLDTKPKQIDQLDPTAAVIYTIILGDHLEVIAAIAGQPLRHYTNKLPPAELELVINSAHSQLAEPRRLNLKLFQQAYDWLVRPLEAELEASQIKTLVFVPDGILRNLPPATLHDGKQYLIEKYSTAIAPSLQLTELSAIAPDSHNILLAGLSQPRQGFSSLPGVKQEIEQIQSLLNSLVLLNSNFTKQNFNRSASQTPFQVVHLATHGQFSSDAADTFILTWDNRINIDELNRLLRGDSKQIRPIELLVLSACETAMGDDDAALGLAGIAVRAGARSTVASLWPVNDLATATLMTHFYKAFASGNITKAEALRQAQISILKQDPLAHPFFWSAFILVGNWQ